MQRNRREFDRILAKAIRRLPAEIRSQLDNLIISVRDRPPPQLLEEMGLPPDEPLLGVFQGVPLPEQSLTAPPLLPASIIVFQGPLEEICETSQELEEEIEITLAHEVAHFLGIDEERLVELGYG